MKCTEKVWPYCRHPHPCINTARWRVCGRPRCGVHAQPNDYYVKKYGRVPIKDEATK